MKPKKNAFAHSSTGYGKHHNRQYNNNNNNRTTKTETEASTSSKPTAKLSKEEKLEKALEDDKNLNSGFGDYLRTPEAVEMMKLFVFANTVMMIVTMAWPHISEQYYWVRAWFASFQSD